MACYGEHRFGLDWFCTCTGNTAMTLSQLNKYSGLNANIYMDSCILADVLFIHNIINVFTLIMSHINGPQIQREEIKCLKTLYIGLHLYHAQNFSPEKTSAP